MVELCERHANGLSGSKQGNPVALTGSNPSVINTRGPHGSDPRETAENYQGELFRIGRYRVVVCREDLQWLYQRRRSAFKAGGAAWNTLYRGTHGA